MHSGSSCWRGLTRVIDGVLPQAGDKVHSAHGPYAKPLFFWDSSALYCLSCFDQFLKILDVDKLLQNGYFHLVISI